MRERYGFLVVFWTILTCLVMFAPQASYAQEALTPAGAAANPPMPAGTPPVDTPLCPGVAAGTNTVDNAARAATNAQAQSIFNNVMTMSTMFPVQSAANACLQRVQQLFTTLAGMNVNAAGFGTVIAAAAAAIIASVIGQICNQVMSAVTAIQNELTNLAKICIPLPNFGGLLNLPKFNLGAGCSGGLVIPLISWGGASQPNQYLYNQYMQ